MSDRSVSPEPRRQALTAGDLFRESHLIPGLVKRRYGAVIAGDIPGIPAQPPVVVIGKANKAASDLLRRGQRWPLAAGTQLTEIESRKFSVKAKGVVHTAFSLVTGHAEMELVTFALHPPAAAHEQRSLRLAFSDRPAAEAWRTAIQQVTDSLAAPDSGQPHPASHGGRPSGTGSGGLNDGSSLMGHSQFSAASSTDTYPAAAKGANGNPRTVAGQEEDLQPCNSLESEMAYQDALEHAEDEGDPNDAPQWVSYSYQDGFNVYLGQGGVNDGALMLSFIVRAPPHLCLQGVLQRPRIKRNAHGTVSLAAEAPEILQTIDAQTQIVRGHWHASSRLARLFTAPREFVARRSWRQDEDGSYIITFQSADCSHLGSKLGYLPPRPMQPLVRAAGAGPSDGGNGGGGGSESNHGAGAAWGGADAAVSGDRMRGQHDGGAGDSWWWQRWHTPVQAQLAHAGYTFAPLAPQYAQGGESPETLVTYVAKFDFGGWLSDDSWGMQTLHTLRRLMLDTVAPTWVPMLIRSAVELRNRVEQERFMVKPFSLTRRETFESSRPSDEVEHAADRAAASVSVALPQEPPSQFASTHSLLRQHSIFLTDSLKETVAVKPPLAARIPGADGTLDRRYWGTLAPTGFKVRGPNYLRDRRKIPAALPIFSLAAVDLVRLAAPTHHIARFLPSIRASSAAFTFLVQIMVPGSRPLSLTVSWAAACNPKEVLHRHSYGGSSVATTDDEGSASEEDDATMSPFDLSLARFLAGGDDPAAVARRNATFKLIPRITEGSWVVKQSVGTTPVLLGRKLTTSYFRGPNYLEVDVDIGSNSVASTVVGLVAGATRSLVIDLAILLEGHTADELPEQLLGTVRLNKMDMSTAPFLEVPSGHLVPVGGAASSESSPDPKSKEE